ncbi:MAG: PQQ-binding-like beta-propeller repeat protein [Verrucomicrobiales bacterium]
MPRFAPLPLAAAAAAFAFHSLAAAADPQWGNWRGPNYDGSSPETGLPEKFSKEENVAWSADMPGPAASTPAIAGDRVFVSSADPKTEKLWALCLDRKTGKELWKKEVGKGFQQDNRSNYASPSPVTDGKIVVFFYGTADLVCFDVAGDEIWARNIQKDHGDFAFLWTFSSSPLLHGGKLYLQVLQRDTAVSGRGKPEGNESYLLAMDPATGKDLWKHVRPADAVSESLEAFSTPMPYTHGGREELIIAGGDCITGHDPETGKEIWRWGTWNPEKIGHWRLVPSPVAGAGVALACAPKGAPVYAVKLGGSGKAEVAWTSEANKDVTSDVATPLFYDGKFYILAGEKRDKTLSCVDPKSGKVIWSGVIPSRAKMETSPTGADGKIYLMSHSGEVYVVKAGGSEFKILHQTDMGERGDADTRSSIAAANGQLFIRTNAKLFCIGE